MTEPDVVRDDVVPMLKAPTAAVRAPETAVETALNSGCCKVCDEIVVDDARDVATAADDKVVTDVVATATADVTAVANVTEAVTGVREAADVATTGKLTETVAISLAKAGKRSRDAELAEGPVFADDVAVAAAELTADPDAYVTVSDAATTAGGDATVGDVTSGADGSGTVVITRVSVDTRRLWRTCLRLDARPGLSPTTSRCSVSSDESRDSDSDDTFN